MIRTIAFSILFFLQSPPLFAKGDRMEHILEARTVELNRIKVIPSKNKVFLPNEYGSEELQKLKRLDDIEGRVVLGIDFVYTSYAEVSSFDQRKLNRKRLKELKEKMPRLVEDPTIEWRKVVQTGASSPEEGRGYFHGFRITLRPSGEKATLEKERKFLRKTVSGADAFSKVTKRCSKEVSDAVSSKGGKRSSSSKTGKSKKTPPDTGSEIKDYTEASAAEIAGMEPKAASTSFGTAPSFEGGRFKFFNHLSKQVRCPNKAALEEEGGLEMLKASFLVSPSGAIMAPAIDKKEDPCSDSIKSALRRMPLWEPGKHEGKPVLTQVILSLNFSKARPSTFIDTIKRVTIEELASKNNPFYSSELLDTLHKGGYSYPFFSAGGYDPSYIEDCSVLKVMERNKEHWNDMLIVCDVTGSMSPYIAQLLAWFKGLYETERARATAQHITLFDDSERIYQQPLETFDSLKTFFLDAFGGGGDTPENNLEGLIEGIKAAPKVKDVVMIADNYATPHDMERLSELERPVHVILCGAKGGINPSYMEFVRKNEGSLHTIESDLRDLSSMSEGDRIEIQGAEYVIEENGVERVY